MSIRLRLTLFFTLLFTLLFGAAQAALYGRVSRSLHRDFKDEMTHDARLVAEIFKEELRLAAIDEFEREVDEFDIDLRISDSAGRIVVQSPEWSAKGTERLPSLDALRQKPVYREFERNGDPFAVFSRIVNLPGVGEFSLHVVRSQEAVNRNLETIRTWVLVLTPVMIFFSGIAGFFFASRALEPVERLRRRAEAIGSDDLSARVPLPPFRDELHRLAETLNRMLDRIEASFEQLRRFTADASHELRIPLTALRGHLEVTLRKDRSPAEYKETIENALIEAEQLSDLIQDLLLLANAEGGRIELRREPVKVGAFLSEIIDQGRVVAGERGLELRLGDVADGVVSADPDRLRQLFFNLIDNALKYNRPGGSVELSAGADGDAVVFAVKDTGVGIPPEDQGKVFERFYRVDKARSREQGGSGLGLSIAQWIVKAHGGRIWVESTPGVGTVFRIRLPKESPAAVSPA